MTRTKTDKELKDLVSKLDDYILSEEWPESPEDQQTLVSLAYKLFDDIEIPDVDQLEFELQAVDKLSNDYQVKLEELRQAEKTARTLTVIEALLTGLHKAFVMHELTRPEVEAFKKKSLSVNRKFLDELMGWLGLECTSERRVYISKDFFKRWNPHRGTTKRDGK
jgi:hypothetical protein